MHKKFSKRLQTFQTSSSRLSFDSKNYTHLIMEMAWIMTWKTHGLNELDFIKNCIRFRSHILIWSEFIAVYLLYIALRLLLDNIIKWIKKILSPLEKKQQFYTPLLSNIPYLSVSKWYFWLASFIITPRVHVALSFHFYLCKFPSNNYHKNYLHLKIM